jgi:hypothetical protein
MHLNRKPAAACLLFGAILLAACGSSSTPPHAAAPTGSTTAPPATTSTQSSTAPASTGSGAGAGALSAEAHATATGDIPDNQVFLVFTNAAARYSIKYPEGWTRSGSSNNVTFRDKNNIVHVVTATGPPPTPASVTAQLNSLKHSNPTLAFQKPQVITLGGRRLIKTVYTTLGAPDPVTNKRVTLIVDRYALAQGSRVAIVDLGTPTGVDNVDAYRKMIESFTWQ